MAKIIWLKRASRMLDEHLTYASAEFGKATAKRWMREIDYVETRIASMPLSFTQEPLLADKRHVYRYCHLMNRRFKIIYSYYPSADVVRVVDIWDTRMNPETLRKRLK